MEPTERIFYETLPSDRKYAKHTTIFINYLIEKQRYLEAKFIFEKLYNLKASNAITIRLGYTLSIALFDSKGVEKFDRLLIDSQKSEKGEIEWYQLRYYQSRNLHNQAENICARLLKLKLPPEYLTTITEFCLNNKNYPTTAILCQYLSSHNLRLQPRGTAKLRAIALQKLVNVIAGVKLG
ncbi:hypothetical protein M2401_001089 [Pseudomonas sp. JUb42]|uniref:hypothetical protein n=1 Tax=Pseudomonas sp. JUb42 TaxID=2940611 RepID=UPI0021677DD3|nr:hypothetical protein [Pseudomonas sp. JUb42]MCS3467368.1 hypothetical protein [Pseudomonas sp. JUb42]